jgi:WD40 repeat protein
MSSLVDLPEIIGFFSYSREDDDAFKGTLSALRDAIQRELSAQLGRSKKTFRLWQDQEAIAPGRLWESEIKNAVEQSVFFIPIVTPRAVNSEYCHFEFEAFLARERALDRTDLVFPILYIAVPALADEAQWRNHPVLSAIGKRQWIDWRQFRHQDVHSTVVREAIERFCGKIVEALQRLWQSPEERRRQEELEAAQRAEEDRRRQEAEVAQRAEEEARGKKDEAEAERIAEEHREQEAEAKRRADEEENRKRAEVEARQRAEEERRVSEAEANQRADQERAFAAAKRVDTPDGLSATLITRDEGHRTWRPSRRAVVIGGGALGAGAAATAAGVITNERDWPPIYFYEGNVGDVQSVAIAPDGRIALSGSKDNNLRLWDLASGSRTRTLTGHTSDVRSVAIAPDSRTAISGSSDRTLRLWDLASGTTIRTLLGHTDTINAVAIAPDGRTALTGGGDTSVLNSPRDFILRLWDLDTGNTIRTLPGHHEDVESVAIAPDGRTALSGSRDKSIRLWDLANGNTIRTFWHDGFVTSVAFAPDGRTALSGCTDNRLRLWNLAGGDSIRTLTGHTSWVNSVAFAPDGRTALSGSDDKTLRLWNLSSGRTIRIFANYFDITGVKSVAIAPDGRTALSGGYSLTLWPLTWLASLEDLLRRAFGGRL